MIIMITPVKETSCVVIGFNVMKWVLYKVEDLKVHISVFIFLLFSPFLTECAN